SRRLKIHELKEKLQRSHLLLTSLVILLLILAVDNYSLRHSQRVVLMPTPKSTSHYWVEQDKVSDEMLEDISDEILRLMLNVTPETVHGRIERVLRFAHPKVHASMKAKLTEDADFVKSQEISQSFVPQTYVVEKNGTSVRVAGFLNHWVSGQAIKKETATYRIQYAIESGMPLVRKIEEVDNETH